MKQEFQIGDNVAFKIRDYYAKEEIKYTGTIIEYNEKGYYKKPLLGFKRYRILVDDGSIIFLGASRMKKVND